jgi:D-alanyl-D-alanine carboxypeptidase
MKLIRKILFVIILIGGIAFLYNQFDQPVIEKPDYEGDISIVNSINKDHYTYIPKKKSDISKGELILVNNDLPYLFTEGVDLVTVYDYKNSSYKVKDLNVKLNASVMEPLNELMKKFHDLYETNAVTVVSGHRSYDFQEILFNQKVEKDGEVEAMKWIAKPGGSEHHTGLALDFSIYHSKGRSQDYSGNGKYRWINENAYLYGFIVRYPEEKSDITGIEYEPWHFRYIGIPHSYIATEYGMCLEEYIDYLKQFQFGKKHLNFRGGDGKQYEVYYSDRLDVPVPTNKRYKISGNNADGFIVTVIYK